LGGRVKLNAWDNHVELIKTMPVAITSARHKMPLEVTPFSPGLPAPEQSSTRPLRRTPRTQLQAIRKENGAWKFLHRHADPLVEKKAPSTVTH
jgi:hypothetical protein